MVESLNLSGPCKNIITLWQYLILQINQTLPNLTLTLAANLNTFFLN